jgi:hypothetical protein
LSSQTIFKNGIKEPFSQVTNPNTKNKVPMIIIGNKVFLPCALLIAISISTSVVCCCYCYPAETIWLAGFIVVSILSAFYADCF